MATKSIINSIKLPKEVEDELINDLKTSGTAFILGIGRFSVTSFMKKMAFIPDKRGKMFVSKSKKFSRIGFRAAKSFKKNFE